ncbi:hypothetical protein GO986_14655 [Deinococcus sp. HMF7620]|uniref:Uncharacterized protein n=1 Tax=Deinococcus arboris TaxID=2682977 RepID=A0A7C9I0N2_9DEIO|nr:hypothetical protein [Deinococcus arboris]MVN87995.1 hypothetical protein [Deinococcus arboris]
MRRMALGLLLLGSALAGGDAGLAWRSLSPTGGWQPAAAVVAPTPCPALNLPATWEVSASAFADVTGDGSPECVLTLWRPWRNWPIHRWSAGPTPITANRDAAGRSAHVAVLRPLPGGAYREVWVGSALYRPVRALSVRPGGTLVTLEVSYAAPSAPAQTLSEWHWTSFGFDLVRRVPVRATALGVDARGWPAVR